MSKLFLQIIILISFSGAMFPQKGGIDVSLIPDFIYTRNSKSVGVVLTKSLPLITSVANDVFFMADARSEYFEPMAISSAKISNFFIPDTSFYTAGFIDVSSGNEFLPSAKFQLSFPSKQSSFIFNFEGKNRREFEPFSAEHSGSLSAKYVGYNHLNATFLPTMEYSIEFGGKRSVFNFYGTDNPSSFREINRAYFVVDFFDRMQRAFNYGVKISASGLELSKKELSEQNLLSSGYFKTQMGIIEVNSGATFSYNFTSKGGVKSVPFGVLSAYAIGGFSFSKTMKILGGINYTQDGSESRLSPKALFQVRFSDGFELVSEFSPEVSIYDNFSLLSINKYINLPKSDHLFSVSSIAASVSMKFEYSNFLEITTGIKYFKNDSYPIFADNNSRGIYEVTQVEATSKEVFLNFTLLPAANAGKLYSEVRFQQIEDNSGDRLPYHPLVTGKLNYGFGITNDLYSEFTASYNSEIKENKLNNAKYKDNINSSFTLKFSVSNNFILNLQASNLLNRQIYFLNNYLEPGVTIGLGLSLKWH